MNNKVLIIVYVPLLDKSYDLFIPINKKVGTIKNIIINIVYELSNGALKLDNLNIYDKETGNIFYNDIFVKNSEIRNGTKIILM